MYDILYKDEECTIVKEEKAADPRNHYIIPKKENEDDILVIKVGSEERPASQEDIEALQNMLAIVQKDPCVTLITHHCIQFETIPRSCLGGSLIMAIGSENKVKKIEE